MKYIRKYWLSVLSFCFIFLLICFCFQSIQESTKQNQKESLEKALKRGVIECYALEGYYPESLDYLIENYHIIYNEDEFDVKYEIFASNIMPTITVIQKD